MAERQERRKSKRINRHFVITYRVHDRDTQYDLSQIKNISKGGLRFTTSKQYPEGTILSLELRTPVTTDRIKFLGKVVSSKVVLDGLIWDTRVAYVDMDEDTKRLVDKTIQYFGKSEKKKAF